MIWRWLFGRKPAPAPAGPAVMEWEHAENWSGHWSRCTLADGRVGTGVGPTECTAQRRARRDAEARSKNT